MKKEILRRLNNIGALCNFLKKKDNKKYLNYLNKELSFLDISLTIPEKIYYFVNKINCPILCTCGNKKKFIGFKNGYRNTCGKKECYVSARKKTCLDKYGVDNPKKSKEVLDKEQKNIKKKWNGKHYMEFSSVKNKFNTTMKERHGVEWAQQSKEISKKSVNTFLNNPDRDNIIKQRSDSFKEKYDIDKGNIEKKKKETIAKNWGSYDNFIEYRLGKIKESSIENWDTDHHFKSDVIAKKRIKSYENNKTKAIINSLPNSINYISRGFNNNKTDYVIELECSVCNSVFGINRQLLGFRQKANENICLICNPISNGTSAKEKEVIEFIENIYKGNIIKNAKNIISKELDIYLPEEQLAFEFNGLYWHSDLYRDKKYHLSKTNECLENGINLIHIWEDDWDYKKEIIKSIITNKLVKSKRIYGRKCIVKEINDNNLVRIFLEENHIQGFVGSKVKLGLYYNNELVSIMTFGKLRKSLGHKSSEDKWELLRFCNKVNTTVVGGASKLFKYFIKNYKYSEIISYSDVSRGVGKLYEILDFEYSHQSNPNYYWVVNGVKKHRFNYRKDKLVSLEYDKDKTEVEIMNSLKYYRIFDCGSKKWIFKN